MDRRNFIRNSIIALGGCCLLYDVKFCHDNQEELVSAISHINPYLEQKYLLKSELPKKLRIDACSMCQLNCPGCFVRLNEEKVRKSCGFGYLKFKDFKKLVDENDIQEVALSNLGEIFLNPELIDIIRYAYEKDIRLSALTGVNLNYLTDEMAEALVKYDFGPINVSIDGATPKTYAIYRRGGDFHTVINNIKKINYYKSKYDSPNPDLTYKFILFGHNEHEIDKAKRLAESLDMHISFVPNYYDRYSPVKDLEMIKKKTGLDLRKSFNEITSENYKKNPNANWWHCKYLWSAPQINWDGKVLGCCHLYWDCFGGNAFKEGLQNALNNPKYIYAKNMIANNKKPKPDIPCSNCELFKFLKDHKIRVKPKNKQGTEWA